MSKRKTDDESEDDIWEYKSRQTKKGKPSASLNLKIAQVASSSAKSDVKQIGSENGRTKNKTVKKSKQSKTGVSKLATSKKVLKEIPDVLISDYDQTVCPDLGCEKTLTVQKCSSGKFTQNHADDDLRFEVQPKDTVMQCINVDNLPDVTGSVQSNASNLNTPKKQTSIKMFCSPGSTTQTDGSSASTMTNSPVIFVSDQQSSTKITESNSTGKKSNLLKASKSEKDEGRMQNRKSKSTGGKNSSRVTSRVLQRGKRKSEDQNSSDKSCNSQSAVINENTESPTFPVKQSVRKSIDFIDKLTVSGVSATKVIQQLSVPSESTLSIPAPGNKKACIVEGVGTDDFVNNVGFKEVKSSDILKACNDDLELIDCHSDSNSSSHLSRLVSKNIDVNEDYLSSDPDIFNDDSCTYTKKEIKEDENSVESNVKQSDISNQCCYEGNDVDEDQTILYHYDSESLSSTASKPEKENENSLSIHKFSAEQNENCDIYQPLPTGIDVHSQASLDEETTKRSSLFKSKSDVKNTEKSSDSKLDNKLKRQSQSFLFEKTNQKPAAVTKQTSLASFFNLPKKNSVCKSENDISIFGSVSPKRGEKLKASSSFTNLMVSKTSAVSAVKTEMKSSTSSSSSSSSFSKGIEYGVIKNPFEGRKKWGGSSNNSFRKKKSCPFYKRIPDTTLTVDAFNYGDIPDCKAYILSHFHYDHYGGLTKKFQNDMYCSKVTANLVISKLKVNPKCVHVLPMNSPCKVEGVEVILMDANHCPGSVIFLFKLPNGRTHLHTGDFRANTDMESYKPLNNVRIDNLYLDTTYCDKSYDFPPQSKVIDFAVTLAVNAVCNNPKTLIVCGCYTIGKERVFIAIAQALDIKISVMREKKVILDCLEDRVLQNLVTLDWKQSRLHVLPMAKLNEKDLSQYLAKHNQYNSILAFSPTGWTHSNKVIDLYQIKPKHDRNGITIYGIPYSEHSSYLEMKRFVQFIKPAQIIPTVNNGNPSSRKKMENIFKLWMDEEKDNAAQSTSSQQLNLDAWFSK